ncbi:MAG: DUF4339 domain-containing protein [Verrucomicrobia bacterium]|nr:DUF4339 domain-containing protein [Verrucomicrobiota bacterium]MCH8513020.1 DUF4339 domain-containing protein [Kiritimatiellia bacterium]
MDDWFYMYGGKLNGPCSFEELQALVDCGRVMKKAMVWTEGMDHWKSADEVPEIVWKGEEPKPQLTISPEAKIHKEKELAEAENISRLKAKMESISVFNWLCSFVVALIPLVNFVVLMNWAFGDNNTPRSKVTWARATLLTGLILSVVGLLFWLGVIPAFWR